MDSSAEFGMASKTTHVTGTFFLFEMDVLSAAVVDNARTNENKKLPVSLTERSNHNSGQGGVYEAKKYVRLRGCRATIHRRGK